MEGVMLVVLDPTLGQKILDLFRETQNQAQARGRLLATMPTVNNPSDPLTPREVQVLQLLVEGKKVREVGQQLFIAPSTVKNHVQSIYGKLQVSNRAEAVRKAIHSGIVVVQ